MNIYVNTFSLNITFLQLLLYSKNKISKNKTFSKNIFKKLTSTVSPHISNKNFFNPTTPPTTVPVAIPTLILKSLPAGPLPCISNFVFNLSITSCIPIPNLTSNDA